MPDPVHLQLDWFRDVVADEFKTGVANPASDIGFGSCEVVVKADHFITGFHQPIDQMGAEEPGTSSHEVNLHTQGVRSASTIAGTGAIAMVDSSAFSFNGFKRTSPRSASSSPSTRAQRAPLRSARLNCLPKAELD